MEGGGVSEEGIVEFYGEAHWVGSEAEGKLSQGQEGPGLGGRSEKQSPHQRTPAGHALLDGGLSHEATSPLAQVAKIWDAYVE